MSNSNTNTQRRRGFSLVAKLAVLVGGLGVLMTATFTVLNAVQMREEITVNYHHTLEAIVQMRERLLVQQYSHVEEMRPLITEPPIAESQMPKQGGSLLPDEWKEPVVRDSTASGRFAPDQDAASPLVEAEGKGALQLQRLLEETPGELPLGARFVLLDKRSVALAPAGLREQKLPIIISAGLLAQASLSRRVHVWHGESGSYLYRVLYFAPQEWYVVCFMPLSTLEEVLARRIRQMLVTGLFLTLLGVVLAYWFGLRLSTSVCVLDKAARVLPTLDMRGDILMENGEENAVAPLRGVCRADSTTSSACLLPTLHVARSDELGVLARSFECMVQQLQENVRNMLAVAQAQARVQGDLRWGRAIQDGLLPREFPSHPALDVHGCVLPAREVGGDFFDVFMLDDRYCCFAVGNVADKGVSAALAMSAIVCLTRSLVRQSAAPAPAASPATSPAAPPSPVPGVAAVLTQVNAALCRDNSRNMLVTMILGVLDCTTGVMTWANAGHLAPLLFCPEDEIVENAPCAAAIVQNGAELPRIAALRQGIHKKKSRVEVLPTRQEMALGGYVATEYSTFTRSLNRGDRVVLYTDGVPEAQGEDGKRFGSPPEYFEGPPLSASAFNWCMVKKIQMFVAGAPQANDIALLNFMWRGPQG